MYVRVSACVQQDTCVWHEGQSSIFSLARSPSLAILSLLPLLGATGWSQLAWRPPVTPTATGQIPLALLAPPAWWREACAWLGAKQEGRQATQALAMDSDTPWAVSSASTLSR